MSGTGSSDMARHLVALSLLTWFAVGVVGDDGLLLEACFSFRTMRKVSMLLSIKKGSLSARLSGECLGSTS